MDRIPATGLRLAFAAAALVGLAACSQGAGQGPAAADTSADVAALKAGEAQWNEELRTRALESVVGRYAHDGVLMAPGMAPVVGADDLRSTFTDVLTDPGFSLVFKTDKVVVAASGDLAYTSGTYVESTTNPKTHAVDHEKGSYVTVYHKASNGAWKAVADINTPGAPGA